MKKIKQVLYAVFAVALATAPTMAGAQWSVGQRNAAAGGTPRGTIIGIVEQTMYWLLAVIGFIGIIGFVISGILYLTAAGDEAQIEKAKGAMMYSIIGIIVALLGFVVIQAVTAWLSGASSTF